MEQDANASSFEMKNIDKVKSHNNASLKVAKNDSAKSKSFKVNEAVRSLDLALGRLKKSKLVNGEYRINSSLNSAKCDNRNMFLDINSSTNVDNASLMSMNFSHYELMRDLSHSNCNSDGAFSGTTCSSADSSLKNEHLERYFRSAEMWARNYREGGPSAPFEMQEK